MKNQTEAETIAEIKRRLERWADNVNTSRDPFIVAGKELKRNLKRYPGWLVMFAMAELCRERAEQMKADGTIEVQISRTQIALFISDIFDVN